MQHLEKGAHWWAHHPSSSVSWKTVDPRPLCGDHTRSQPTGVPSFMFLSIASGPSRHPAQEQTPQQCQTCWQDREWQIRLQHHRGIRRKNQAQAVARAPRRKSLLIPCPTKSFCRRPHFSGTHQCKPARHANGRVPTVRPACSKTTGEGATLPQLLVSAKRRCKRKSNWPCMFEEMREKPEQIMDNGEAVSQTARCVACPSWGVPTDTTASRGRGWRDGWCLITGNACSF